MTHEIDEVEYYLLDDDGFFVLDDENAENCCCLPEGGCCPDTLIPGTGIVLDAEITGLTGNASDYFDIGDHWTLTETSPGIWSGATDNDPFDKFKNVVLSCVDDNQLSLIWGDDGAAPGTDTSTIGAWRWTQDSGNCDPFEFVFTWEFNEDPITGVPAGLVGSITVKITIVP